LGIHASVAASSWSAAGSWQVGHHHRSRASALFASLGATVESLREPELGSFVWVDVPLRISRFRRTAANDQEAFAELRAAAETPACAGLRGAVASCPQAGG
jgi:hypothetical protein